MRGAVAALLAGGALALAWGSGLLTLARWDAAEAEAREAAAAREVVAVAETTVGADAAVLDRLLDEASRRMAEASAAAPDTERDETAEARLLLTAAQGAFAAARAPQGAVLTVYDANAPDQPAVGRVTASGEPTLLAAVPVEGRLGGAAVEALTRGPAGENPWIQPGPAWTWFEAAGPAGVRLHRGGVHHEVEADVEDDGKTPVLVQSTLLLVASAPFTPSAPVSARTDVAEGRLAPALAVVPAGPGGAGGRLVPALEPARGGWRFPAASAEPRLLVPVPPAARSVTGAAWAALGLAGAVLAVLVGRLAARAGPPGAAPPAVDVTAEAAHEMRTPLTVLRGALDVALRRERAPEEYRETLRLCQQEVKGLQDLQDAVLFLGRGARVRPAMEPVDLAALVEAEVARTATAHPERRVTLETSGDTGLRGDPSLLARLVANLLDNAALHSVPGGAVAARLAGRADAVELTVEDDGPGIPAARAERVFERFYRGPEASRRGVPGSGLGLPIARWVAELHGGTLTLDPEPADRARFRLRLPRAGA